MNEDILVSLVMPVYNGAKFMRESLDSILSQTHKNWEFIIVNEYGSNDGSMEILNEYADKDDRFVIVQNEKRLGISESMNIGLRMAKGKYIARMDSDDISLPTRLEKQVQFMEEHSDIDMCGTRVRIFGTRAFDWKLEFDPGVIDSNLLFYSPCIHPTIMMRTSFMRENRLEYNPNYKATEDFDLFSRIGSKGKISNVNDVLFKYRLNDDNTTFRNNDVGLKIYDEIIGRQCEALGLSLTSDEVNLLSPHGKMQSVSSEEAIKEFSKLDVLLKRIFIGNEHVHRYDCNCLMKTLNKRFTEAYYTVRKKCNLEILDRVYHNSFLSYDSLEYERAEEPEEPLITIILPTFNSQDYLLDTLWSAVRQTEKRFELFVINECGSDDDTVFVAGLLGDIRIHVIQNKERLGLAESLNLGMRLARGKYIARMDADDVSVPDRLEKQLSYMESNPNCGLCGSWQRHYSPGYIWVHKTSVENDDIKAELIYNCDMCHSTVMMRRESFVNNDLYYDSGILAEDWDLWYRASDHMGIHNIPEILGDYREGVDNITTEKFERLSAESGIIVALHIKERFDIDVDKEHVPLLTGWENKFSSLQKDEYSTALEKEKKLIENIYQKNEAIRKYDSDSLLRTLTKRWLTVNGCYHDYRVGSIEELFKKRTMIKCKGDAGIGRINKFLRKLFRADNQRCYGVNKTARWQNIVRKILYPVFDDISGLKETVNRQSDELSHLKETVNRQSDELSHLKETVNRQSDELSALRETVNSQYNEIMSAESKHNDEINRQIGYVREDIRNIYFDYYRQKKKILFLGLPMYYHNVGDHAIAMGTLEFIRCYFSDYLLISMTIQEAADNYGFLRGVTSPDDIIMMQGGGNMGDLYPPEELLRNRVARDFPDNLIVMLSQTIFFKDESGEGLHNSIESYEGHRKMLLFTRGQRSLELAKRYFPTIDSYCMPDMALMIKSSFNHERKGILLCMRLVDDEGGLTQEERDHIMEKVKQYDPDCDIIDHTVGNIPKLSCSEFVLPIIENYSRHKLVVTDRFHGMIFSILTRTPCVVFRNAYPKNEEYAEWFSGSNAIRFIDNDVGQLIEAMDQMSSVENPVYPILDDDPFGQMAEIIRKKGLE